MIVVSGGHLVLEDRILRDTSLLIEAGRIVGVEVGPVDPAGATVVDAQGGYVVPGFVDVHVHGVEGHDALDGGRAVAELAARLPRYGVTAFCPTSVACLPDTLRVFLLAVGQLRAAPAPRSARVLKAHLESHFINPELAGGQPVACLRVPVDRPALASQEFSGRDILDLMTHFRSEIGIVTLAPELDGGLDLVHRLVAAGHTVSLGHSGADFETAMAAFDAGARQVTHLFNRMRPMTARAPGLAGAALARADVAVEVICDGHHVHPSLCRLALAAKSVRGVLAVTDATAGAGLSVGARARLGSQEIYVGDRAAFLDNGTLAGGIATMDQVFRNVAAFAGRSVVDAAAMCSTNPARELGLAGVGAIAVGAVADVVVLGPTHHVRHTIVDGQLVYSAPEDEPGRALPRLTGWP